MLAKIEQLLQEIEGLQAANAEELEALRIKYLSKKGAINELMADFRNVPAEQKKEVGMKLNELKNKAQERIASLKEAFETQDNSAAEMDLTRTAYPIELGTRHPLSIVKNEIIDIFHRLGFSIADGPEIEDDLHVFTAMNFAEDHPARDMQDTFFIEANQEDVKKNIVLRTHTSSVQARAMEHSQPPIRIICPGRVYRNEAISYRAHAFFHQVEALYIDKNVSFTDLKQVLLLFAKEMCFSHSMASPFTAFTPSDSLATASNSWILILTFPITSLRNLFPNFLRKKDRHLYDVCLCGIYHPLFLILLFYNLFQLFPNFLIRYLDAKFPDPSLMQMLICFCRLPRHDATSLII